MRHRPSFLLVGASLELLVRTALLIFSLVGTPVALRLDGMREKMK